MVVAAVGGVVEPAAASPVPIEGNGDLASRVDRYLAPLVESRNFSGVVLIARGNEILFHEARGLASVELAVPMTTGGLFPIASLTKTFTAAAVVQLAAAGKLSFGDPLDRFVPELPAAGKIRIEHLLLHQGGLPEEWELPDYRARMRDRMTLVEGVRRLADAPMRFAPGSDSAYSNAGYLTLALVVERASGQPFGTYLSNALLAPLGMHETVAAVDAGLIPGAVSGYEPGPPPERLLPVVPAEPSHGIGSGHMLSTAGDLHRWLLAVNRRQLFDLEAQAYPYGWGRRNYFGRDALEQSGVVPGFVAEMLTFPAVGLHVVYLSNIQSGVVFGKLLRGLAAIALGMAPEPIEIREVAGVPGDVPLEGRFRLDGPGEFAVVAGPGGWYLEWLGFGQRAYLEPIGDGRYYVRKDDAVLLPRRAADGRVEAVVWNPGENEMIARRVN